MEKTNKKEKNNLKSLQEKVKKFEEGWKRALADYRNLEKRFEEERKNIVKEANYNLILDLLPVLDNLEEATKYIKDKGLEACIKQFKSVLNRYGVEEIKAQGKKFDPEIMEAIDTAKGEENKVVKVSKRGFMLGEKLLRPAQVIVGKKEEKNA